MSDTNTPVFAPTLGLKTVALLLGHDLRWMLLRELAKGEPLPASELGRRIGMERSTTSKNLALMRRLGLVKVGYGRLYSLTPAYRPAPGTSTIDFGYCVVRLDTLAS